MRNATFRAAWGFHIYWWLPQENAESGRLFGSDRGLAFQVFYSVLNSLEPLTHLGNRQILNSCLTETELRLPYWQKSVNIVYCEHYTEHVVNTVGCYRVLNVNTKYALETTWKYIFWHRRNFLCLNFVITNFLKHEPTLESESSWGDQEISCLHPSL